jgi:membrane protein YqaA with SNARE-associated domain
LVQPSATPLPTERSAADDAALDAYVRRKVLMGLLGLVLMILAVGLAGLKYETELFAVTQAIHHALGVGGLVVILFLSDSIITPIPPDLILVVIAKSDLRIHFLSLLLLLGVVSTLAGNVAWFLGGRLSNVEWVRAAFGRFRRKNAELVLRYGGLGVALGSLTPIPFSVTCWTAGLLHVRWRSVFWATLLRIPRFYIYYFLIAYSDTLTGLLFSR